MTAVANYELPIYESRRTTAGMWQRYLVFRDRVELRSLVGIYRIPLNEIVSIKKVPPGIKALKEGGSWVAIKLDMADLVPHVLLHRTGGTFKYLRFTPDDIDSFIATVLAAKSKYRP